MHPRPPSRSLIGALVTRARRHRQRGGPGPLSRGLLSAFLVLTVGATVVSAMPASALRGAVHPVVEPYLQTTGLTQGWGMFAPDPPRYSTELVALLSYADGSTARWEPPDDDGVLGAYRSYRWRKWSFAARDDDRPSVQAAMAEWLAEEVDHQGRRPVRVELVRRWQELAPPGSDEADGAWQQRTYLTLDVEPGVTS